MRHLQPVKFGTHTHVYLKCIEHDQNKNGPDSASLMWVSVFLWNFRIKIAKMHLDLVKWFHNS
jgi:hypothetical protein